MRASATRAMAMRAIPRPERRARAMPSLILPIRITASRVMAMRISATQASRMRASPTPVSPRRTRRSAIWSRASAAVSFSTSMPRPSKATRPTPKRPAQDYVMSSQDGQVPQSDPRRQLQAFDAIYDQPPQIALGSTEPERAAPPQDFYRGRAGRCRFPRRRSGRFRRQAPAPSRHDVQKAAAPSWWAARLLGAIALGGALAFAYKQSGGGHWQRWQPPLVTADSRPGERASRRSGRQGFSSQKQADLRPAAEWRRA